MNLQESIRRILKEETQGVDSLIQTLSSKYEISEELKNFIVNFINNSDCKRINFSNLKIPVMGLALHDGVLINNTVLGKSLEFALFVILHEIAHQYQFKKYGEDVMYKCYIGEVSLDDASKFMKNTEEVADEFATRKIRELEKKGLLKKGFIPPQFYKNMPLSQIQGTTHMFRQQMKMNKIKSPEKISEYFYNMVKSEL
jgi:uncharacterized protein (DUF2132 family)